MIRLLVKIQAKKFVYSLLRDYSHRNISHDRYLVVYERIEEKERDDLFNRCTPRLSIYEDVGVVSNEEMISDRRYIDIFR